MGGEKMKKHNRQSHNEGMLSLVAKIVVAAFWFSENVSSVWVES